MQEINQLWEKTLDLLKAEVPAASFNTWFSELTISSVDEETETLYIDCKNNFATDLLKTRYITLIKGSISAIFNKPYNVEIVFKPAQEVIIQEKEEKLEVQKTIAKDFSSEFLFNPRYNFDNFVVGQHNEYAHAVALAVAEAPSEMYNPLFIYGSSGLGKTHLLHAIGHYILKHSELQVLYVSSEMFTSELITALRDTNSKDKLKYFKEKYRNIDVLLIDDIQFIEGKDATQDEFFHTFNHLHDHNKQIIISSDRPPSKLVNLDDRLRSRFAWKIVADVKPPDFETRVAIFTKKAMLDGIEINDDLMSVAHLVAEKIKYNVRELEGAFTRIISFSTLLNKPITVTLAKEVLKDIFTSTDSHITVDSIKRHVCKYFNVTPKDMDSSKRSKNIALPRQIAMYISRELTEESLPKIGEKFGGRDHTTVLHACKKISKEIMTNEEVNKFVDDLMKIIKDE